MFGAESILLDRCESQDVFNAASDMLNGFKDYFISHGEVVYENPSPGNKDGGITTLEDKSCGCVQKGGSAPIVDVLPYAGRATKHGLNMLCGPGNDMVSTTALTAAGCHVILFSTAAARRLAHRRLRSRCSPTSVCATTRPTGWTLTPAWWLRASARSMRLPATCTRWCWTRRAASLRAPSVAAATRSASGRTASACSGKWIRIGHC